MEMEPARPGRIARAARRAVDDQGNASDVSGGEDAKELLSGASLAQWKRERLAHHHAYFALLDKAFARWRQVTRARQQRRQRVIAACRVGAKFFQRLYWDEWRAMVLRRRTARDAASRLLHQMSIKIRLRAAWVRWTDATATAGRIRRDPMAPIDRLIAERRLEVRGVRLRKELPRVIAGGSRELSVPTTEVQHNRAQTERAESLKRITVYYTQRHYFQMWQEAAQAAGKIVSKQLRDTADAFRVRSAWRRWRRGFVTRSEYHTASRQAVFFLYYHLTKSSMAQLRRFAARQRHERGVAVVLSSRVRRRRLTSAYLMWRQRFNTKLIFTQWRDIVSESSRTHLNPQLRVVHDVVRELEKNRMLHRAFAVWLKQSALRRRSRALVRLLEGPVTKVALAPVFRLWRQKTVMQQQLQCRNRNRDHDRLTRVWQSWTHITKEKERRARQWRTATRFWYYRTLRRTFSAFQTLRARRQNIEGAVVVLAQDVLARHKRISFEQWVKWSARQRQRREASVAVQRCFSIGMKTRAFRALRLNHNESRLRGQLASSHAYKVSRKRLQDAFASLRAQLTHEQRRSLELEGRLASFLHDRATRMKSLVFRALDDYAKSKHSRRLISAHARGHFQSKLLQRSYSAWVSAVAQLKWEHIFNQRAQHFRIQKLSRKCFSRWVANALAMKRYRDKTRRALHHWKSVREREAFDAWRRYIGARRVQRERIHGALEFRHRAYIRDGLSHWIAGATHITTERSLRTVEMQATHTKQVWRKVRDIAFHWRYVTQRNKNRTTHRAHARERVRHTDIPRAFTDDRIETDAYQRERALPTAMAPTRPHRDSAELSEFVMLPRNRPRPRKPIELIVESAFSVVGLDENVHNNDMAVDLSRAVGNVNRLYGFQFPPVRTEITNQTHLLQTPTQDMAYGIHGATQVINSSSREREPNIDELEERLLHWQNRRQRLKQLQHSLEDFRQLLHQAAMQGNLQQDEHDRMQSRLQRMEQQEAASRRRWNESRPEINSLAQRIKLLRGTMTASA